MLRNVPVVETGVSAFSGRVKAGALNLIKSIVPCNGAVEGSRVTVGHCGRESDRSKGCARGRIEGVLNHICDFCLSI